jgi:tetrahydromethanopterin S-methyltransferase subunit D
LKNVLFYDYDENAKDEEAMLQYFTRKVDRYKQQDKKAKREVQNHCYVTVAWLTGCLGKSCSGCGDALIYERGKSNLTAQRIDNTIAHELDNVIPMCVFCNCALSNR